MKKQGGFTLIELVVVIVILGILAVTAAPRFLNLQSDARASSLQGLKGAMAGAAGIVYGKAAIEGIETLPSTNAKAIVDDIKLEYGYPAASADGIGNAVEGLGEDWAAISSASSTGTIVYSFDGAEADTKCTVTYSTNASASAPTITAAEATDC